MSVQTNPGNSSGNPDYILTSQHKDKKEKMAAIAKLQRDDDNLVNNQSLKDAGFDLKQVGRPAPTSLDDTIVKGIDGLYENQNKDSPIRYVIDEAKFGRSRLGKTEDGKQMSDEWLRGDRTKNKRILNAVDGDKELAEKIIEALDNDQVERVLTKIDADGNVRTYRLNSKGENIGTWP